ncbi:MAG: putative glutamine amidotransferase, partial [Thermoleophilaceae bacterium]|nr:putative glutamine amidotransferase [Thermoleophilaceae bacterium]
DLHRQVPGTFQGEHEVRLQPGSLAARAAGAERITVKSHHHQGADRLGEELVPTGWAVPDDLVEAIEVPGKRFVLGVLWHPEVQEGSRVIGSFVEAVAQQLAVQPR